LSLNSVENLTRAREETKERKKKLFTCA